jgi:hypothetical protein
VRSAAVSRDSVEEEDMLKKSYNEETDTVSMFVRDRSKAAEMSRWDGGIRVFYAADSLGEIIGIEITDYWGDIKGWFQMFDECFERDDLPVEIVEEVNFHRQLIVSGFALLGKLGDKLKTKKYGEWE